MFCFYSHTELSTWYFKTTKRDHILKAQFLKKDYFIKSNKVWRQVIWVHSLNIVNGLATVSVKWLLRAAITEKLQYKVKIRWTDWLSILVLGLSTCIILKQKIKHSSYHQWCCELSANCTWSFWRAMITYCYTTRTDPSCTWNNFLIWAVPRWLFWILSSIL